METLTLATLPSQVKQLLIAVLLCLTLGVSLGLGLVFYSNHPFPAGINERFAGSESADSFAIPDHYPMPVKELLVTTHNHIISFTFIFAFMGLLIQFSAGLTSRRKKIPAGRPWSVAVISSILVFRSLPVILSMRSWRIKT